MILTKVLHDLLHLKAMGGLNMLIKDKITVKTWMWTPDQPTAKKLLIWVSYSLPFFT